MTDQKKQTLPDVSVADLQIAIAKLALSLADVAEIAGKHLGPQNALAPPDPYKADRELRQIRKELLALTDRMLEGGQG